MVSSCRSALTPSEVTVEAANLTEALNAQKREAPAKNVHHAAYKASRAFRKALDPEMKKALDPTPLKELEEAESAFLLGLTVEIARANPEFFKRAKEGRLYTYLAFYRHSLQVDMISKTVSVLFKNHYRPWNQIQEEIEHLEREATKREDTRGTPFKEPWRAQHYGPDGITFVDRCHFNSLRPLIQHNPIPWGNKYVFRLFLHAPEPGIKDNHGWFSYGEPYGNEYSFSYYRQLDKPTSTGIFKSYFCHPEISHNWDFPNYSIDGELTVEITPEQFYDLTSEELRLAADPTPVPFHNFDDNCTDAALLRLKKLGYTLPEYKVSFWRVLAPSLALAPFQVVDKILPGPLQKVARKVAAVAENILDSGTNKILQSLKTRGFKVPDKRVSFWRELVPQTVLASFLTVDRLLPGPLQRAARKVIAIAGNLLCYTFFEGSKVGPEYSHQPFDPRYPGRRIVPRYRVWRDLLDETKMDFTSPYYVNEYVVKPAKAWRADQIKRGNYGAALRLPLEWSY